MHKLGLFAVASLLVAPVFAASIALPWNTGVLSNGTLAPAHSVDPYYNDINSANKVYVLGNPNTRWIPANSSSAWIGPDTSDGSHYNGGVYQLGYDLTYDLTGYDASSVVLTGRWSVDNTGALLLNGTSRSAISGYQQWSPFSLSGFQPGLNKIDFTWSDTNGPGGLRVEFLSAIGNLAAPEPASLLLFGLGVSALGLVARRRKSS